MTSWEGSSACPPATAAGLFISFGIIIIIILEGIRMQEEVYSFQMPD